MKILSILIKTVQKLKLNFSHSALFHTNTKVCLIYFGQDYNIQKAVFKNWLITECFRFVNDRSSE